MAGVDPLGMPLGMCDRCYCKTKRARRRDGGIEPCVSGNALPPPKHRSPVACGDPRMGGQAGCHASHTPQPAMAGPPRVVGMAPRPPTVCLPNKHPFGGFMTSARHPWAFGTCLSAEERISQLTRDLDEARRLVTLESRRAEDLHASLMATLTVPSPVTTTTEVSTPPHHPHCVISPAFLAFPSSLSTRHSLLFSSSSPLPLHTACHTGIWLPRWWLSGVPPLPPPASLRLAVAAAAVSRPLPARSRTFHPGRASVS